MDQRVREIAFGEAVKAHRLRLGLTQLQLANAMGWESQGRISNYERGLRRPQHKELVRLCQIFGCTPNDLLVTQDAPIADDSPILEPVPLDRLTQDEIALVTAWRHWSPDVRKVLASMVADATLQQSSPSEAPSRGKHKFTKRRPLERRQKQRRGAKPKNSSGGGGG